MVKIKEYSKPAQVTNPFTHKNEVRVRAIFEDEEGREHEQILLFDRIAEFYHDTTMTIPKELPMIIECCVVGNRIYTKLIPQ